MKPSSARGDTIYENVQHFEIFLIKRHRFRAILHTDISYLVPFQTLQKSAITTPSITFFVGPQFPTNEILI